MAVVNVDSFYQKPVVACPTCSRVDTNLIGIYLRKDSVGALMECPICYTRIEDVTLEETPVTPPPAPPAP